MADVDRTPSIDVCRLFGYFGSSAKMIERLMMLSLKFGGLTTLVAHLLTSRTPGKNPRLLTENPAPTLVSLLSFSLEVFELPTHAQGFLTPTILSLKNFYARPTSLSLLKQCKTRLIRVRG